MEIFFSPFLESSYTVIPGLCSHSLWWSIRLMYFPMQCQTAHDGHIRNFFRKSYQHFYNEITVFYGWNVPVLSLHYGNSIMFSETGSLHYKLIKVNKYITFFPYKTNTTEYYALSLKDSFLLNQPEYLLWILEKKSSSS